MTESEPKTIETHAEPITARVPLSALFRGSEPQGVEGANDQIIKTPLGQPDVRLVWRNPLLIIAVRVARSYLETMLSILAGDAVVQLIPARDFKSRLIVAASLSVATAGISLLRNLVAALAKFDQTHPWLAE